MTDYTEEDMAKAKDRLVEDLWKRIRDLTGEDFRLEELRGCLDLVMCGDGELIEELFARRFITYGVRCEALSALGSRERHPSGLLDLDDPTHTQKSLLGQIRPGEWASLGTFAAVLAGSIVFRHRILRKHLPRNSKWAFRIAACVGTAASMAFTETAKEVRGNIEQRKLRVRDGLVTKVEVK